MMIKMMMKSAVRALSRRITLTQATATAPYDRRRLGLGFQLQFEQRYAAANRRRDDDYENSSFRYDTLDKKFKDKTAYQAVKAFEQWKKTNVPTLRTMIYMAENLMIKKKMGMALPYLKELRYFEIEEEDYKQLLDKAIELCYETAVNLVPRVSEIAEENNINIKKEVEEKKTEKKSKIIWKEKVKSIELPQGLEQLGNKINNRNAKIQRKYEKKAEKRAKAAKKNN